MIPESEENRLDQSLRSKFDDFELTPAAPVWAGIEQRLTPAPRLRPRRRPLLVPLLFVLTALVAGLGGWLLPHGPGLPSAGTAAATRPRLLGNAPAAVRNARLVPAGSGLVNRNTSMLDLGSGLANRNTSMPHPGLGLANRNTRMPTQSAGVPNPGFGLASPGRQETGALAEHDGRISAAVGMPATPPLPVDSAGAVAAAAVPEATPVTLRPLAALERQTLAQLPDVFTLRAGPGPAAGRPDLVANLRAERAELLRLQRRADSLLLALGEVLPGRAGLAARPDSAQTTTKRQQPETRRWSLLLSAAPEQNTLALQTTDNNVLNTLRQGHEMGRTGFSATLLAEYRAAPRLSVGGGVGFTALGADLRITTKATQVSVRYDTAVTHLLSVYSSTHQTYSIRIVQVPQLSPVFNSSGQVIRYDTVYVPRRDTVFTTTVQHDTVRTNHTTITPLISKKDVYSSRLLQPQYRFFTVPVQLRYRLTAPGLSRLWTDVSLGAQLQFFLGGTQVVTDDGENFRTETVRAGEGPFRRLNVALSGALALNYALTPRLSVSVAPSLRWQALSLYRPETGLRQQATATGLMFGVRFGL